jgi:probable F420-dependent oxidoreductase
MKFGLMFANIGPFSQPEGLTHLAQAAENCGIESLWTVEHVAVPVGYESRYPYSEDGKMPGPENAPIPDPLVWLSYAAAVTKKIKLATGILILPQRSPIYTAKEFATLDWLSGGRIDFGIGVGWCKEEVLACGYSWEDRGARCDEFLEVMKRLWTEPVASFEGQHFNLSKCRMDPKPIQNPHIPIIVGGHSKRAFRRAAEFGNGWYGFGINPEQTAAVLKDLDAALERAGRSRDDFEIVITPNVADADAIRAFQDVGVDRLVMHLGSQRPEKVAARLNELEGFANIAA